MPLTSLRWRSGELSCSWFHAGMSTVQYALPPDRATKMCGMCAGSVLARSSSTPSNALSPSVAGSGLHIRLQPVPGPGAGAGGGVAGGGALAEAPADALADRPGDAEPLGEPDGPPGA